MSSVPDLPGRVARTPSDLHDIEAEREGHGMARGAEQILSGEAASGSTVRLGGVRNVHGEAEGA